ncbi:MAG: 50S ribosomal protein L29 [Patescibacteria group bacterium]
MKKREWRTKNAQELQALLEQNRARIAELRFNRAKTRLKNVREVRELRKNIARALTLLPSR